MKRSRRTCVLTAAAALTAAVALVGCQQSSGPDHGPSASAEWPPPSSTEAQPAAATMGPSAESGMAARTTTNKMYYPTGDASSSVILIEKTGPAQVRLGKEYTYQIKVTNLTDAPLHGVTVQETLPGSFTVSKSSASANGSPSGASAAASGSSSNGSSAAATGTESGAEAQPAAATIGGTENGATAQPSDHANHNAANANNATADHAADNANAGAMAAGTPHSYSIGELGPKESRTITVTGTPSQAGALNSCTSVTYNPTLCTTAMVTNPQMKITKEAVGSATGDMCEEQILRYSVTNTGTGDLAGVRVEDSLPEGLTAPDGTNRINFTVGSLAQGQTRTFEVKVKPQSGGQFASAATASADDGVTAKSDATPLNVKAPKLEVTLDAPEKEYIGDQVKYQVTVKNVGDAPARNPTVRIARADESMEGAQTAAGEQGGQQVGELAPGATKKITVPFSARAEGDLKVNAIASDPCGGKAMAAGQTRIAPLPGALLLEAVDDHDPIRIGDNVTYTIKVLNQGSGPDHNIKVIATIPEGEEYISSAGATKGTVSGNKITFEPVPTLTGKQTATWTVTVKAQKPSDVQFRVDMSSQSFPNAATKLEPSRLF